MAARPSERARESLQASRAEGRSFAQAWQDAQRAAFRDFKGYQRKDWEVALEWARPFFHSAYVGRGDRCGTGLDGLLD